VFISLDTAMTENTFDRKTFEPDFTACTVWGVFTYENKWNTILLEAWRDRLGFPQLIERAKAELKATYGVRWAQDPALSLLGGPGRRHEQKKHPDLMIIEEKGSGISLRQMMANEQIFTWPYNPGRADKLSRLHGISHVAAGGRIWLPESSRSPNAPREWILPFLKEVCVYSGPGTTKHDDYVDSFSQGMRFFADRWLDAGVTVPLPENSLSMDVDLDGSFTGTTIDLDVEPPYG
jgi:phage terminase large subunit-like protein